MSMAKKYHCKIEVRGYELDSFGHVNHAIYFNYLEHARWEMLTLEEITLAKFTEWKRWPVVAELQASYLKPTFMGEKLDVESQIVETGKTNFMIEQTILRDAAIVFKAKVRIVMVDETGRPAGMPEFCRAVWTAQS